MVYDIKLEFCLISFNFIISHFCFCSLWGQRSTWNNPRSRERYSLYRKFSQTAQVLGLWNFAQVAGVVEILPRLLGLWNGRVYLWYGGCDPCFKATCRPSPLKMFSKLQKKTNFQEEKFGDRLLQKPLFFLIRDFFCFCSF
jgi:hypothetical protein